MAFPLKGHRDCPLGEEQSVQLVEGWVEGRGGGALLPIGRQEEKDDSGIWEGKSNAEGCGA